MSASCDSCTATLSPFLSLFESSRQLWGKHSGTKPTGSGSLGFPQGRGKQTSRQAGQALSGRGFERCSYDVERGEDRRSDQHEHPSVPCALGWLDSLDCPRKEDWQHRIDTFKWTVAWIHHLYGVELGQWGPGWVREGENVCMKVEKMFITTGWYWKWHGLAWLGLVRVHWKSPMHHSWYRAIRAHSSMTMEQGDSKSVAL